MLANPRLHHGHAPRRRGAQFQSNRHTSQPRSHREGLLTEKKAPSGRGLLVQLSAKGNASREVMIKYRRALDAKIKEQLSAPEIARLIQNLKAIADLNF